MVDGCSEVNSYNIVLLGYTVKEAVTAYQIFTARCRLYAIYWGIKFSCGNSAQTVKINIIDDVTIEDGLETL
jgi:hypothetical protein